MKFEIRIYQKLGNRRKYVRKMTVSGENNAYDIGNAIKFAIQTHMKQFNEGRTPLELKEESRSRGNTG
jgi:hypothetical protein